MKMCDTLLLHQKIISLHDSGSTTAEIAAIIGYSTAQIYYVLRHRGQLEQSVQRVSELTESDITSFRRDYVAGITMFEMRGKYDLSYNGFVLCSQQHLRLSDKKARNILAQSRYKGQCKPSSQPTVEKERYKAKDCDDWGMFEDEDSIPPSDKAIIRSYPTTSLNPQINTFSCAATMCAEAGTA